MSAVSCVGWVEALQIKFAIQLVDSSKVVKYLQKVVLCVDDPSGPVGGHFTTLFFMWLNDGTHSLSSTCHSG